MDGGVLSDDHVRDDVLREKEESKTLFVRGRGQEEGERESPGANTKARSGRKGTVLEEISNRNEHNEEITSSEKRKEDVWGTRGEGASGGLH